MPIELLSPAGSPEGVRAVVQNGADAVYLGLGDFNARRNAKNLSKEEFAEAARYCRARGVKLIVTLNTLLTDKELVAAADTVDFISAAGADAVIVQDLGVLRLVKQVAPDLPIHASTQMSVHNLEGVKVAASLGISRVVLARELSLRQMEFICANSPIETEVFVHGALCMSYSGQCYFSSVIGRRSGNRGLCAQPCRLPYGFGKREDKYPLSLKDLSLAPHINKLREIGVASLKIEGRMKRPEYAAVVTQIFSRAIKEDRNPTPDEMRVLDTAFSRQGFTDGYFTENLGRSMFGIRETGEAGAADRLFKEIRKTYSGRTELGRVPVKFEADIAAGKHAALSVTDNLQNTITVTGPVPEPPLKRALVEAEVNTQLYKTGGTPYHCISAKTRISRNTPGGLTLPISAINRMRRDALDRLTHLRGTPLRRRSREFTPLGRLSNRSGIPKILVQVSNISQISRELIDLHPDGLYIPLTALNTKDYNWKALMESGINIAVVLPRVIGDHEAVDISHLLDLAHGAGIEEAVVGNIGHMGFARAKGFRVRGDFGLNIFNSESLSEVAGMGLSSACLSFELNFAQIRDISKCIDTEVPVYGRLPLMVTENCIIKNNYGRCLCGNNVSLVDRKSNYFPVMREFNHRNVIYNSEKLFLADRSEDWGNIGLWGARIMFTTENPKECVQVLARYLDMSSYEPGNYTRGLYYRGVE